MTDLTPDSASRHKPALRAAALSRRDALEIDDRLAWDVAITNCVLSIFDIILGARDDPRAEGRDIGPVSAYWPMRSEADPRPVLEVLHERGVPLCLPAIVDRRMIFRHWAPYEPLVPGGFGTLVPDPAQPEILPGILLVPMAAFDRRGYRIGYGKGYYDRTLSELGPTLTIGIAYGAQEIDRVPAEPHDRRLDWIVTERDLIACGRGVG